MSPDKVRLSFSKVIQYLLRGNIKEIAHKLLLMGRSFGDIYYDTLKSYCDNALSVIWEKPA